jgi:predicted  nucleic acid-binding Zn-ribbon protein
MSWYKDRYFPELKREVQGEPAEILAVIPDSKHIEAVIKAHHEEMDQVLKLAENWKKGYSDLEKKYKQDIGNAQQTISQLQEENDELKEKIENLENFDPILD